MIKKGNVLKEINANGYEKNIGTLYKYNAIGWLVEKREPIEENKYKLTEYRYDSKAISSKNAVIWTCRTKNPLAQSAQYLL